ncbi:hypothetical protein [Tenacibaculum ovolyticum]|uniref:hypothetical protein n=1 Tax=Tenacibaculum ovolyticum TaxID=104270 RepID=UPI003BAB4F70
MFRKDIGKEFHKQMDNWFSEHPEIKHQWKENELKVQYPNEMNKFLTFEFDSKKIKVQNDNKEKVFYRDLFTNIEEQVFKIRSFWINNMLKKEETEIIKPKLKENEIAIVFCNRKYGQILTTDKNVFTGWGNVYHIFENEKEAKKFAEIESIDESIEINAYNWKDEYIEIMKKN